MSNQLKKCPNCIDGMVLDMHGNEAACRTCDGDGWIPEEQTKEEREFHYRCNLPEDDL
jgi:ribosomal protein S27AE